MGQPQRIREQITRLRRGLPKRTEVNLQQSGGSLRVTVDKEAWQSEGIDYDQPGEVDEYWYEDLGIILIDLSSADSADGGAAVFDGETGAVATDGGGQDGE